MSGRDIISNLPDEIIGKILSQLPTRLAASTSVLSKRWRNLLALVDNLDFDDATVGGGRPLGFPEFVEKTIVLLSTTCPTWNRFSLKFKFRHDDSLVKSWIRTALERGCLELHLENVGWFNIPIPYFTSNTLVKLTISKGIYATHRCHEDSWGRIFPSLKSLSIVAMAFPDFETYHFLINGCPVLEDLSLHYHEDLNPPNWSGGVLCPSIKRMKIYHYFPFYREAHDDVLFDTPNLVYLDYTSYVADKYEVYLGSLVEARLDLLSWERLNDNDGHVDNDGDDNYSDCSCGCCDDDNDNDNACEDEEAASGDYENYWESEDDVLGDATNLVAGISNIKTLHLSPDSLEVFHFCCKSMPMFHNLLTLSFESDKKRGWLVVPLLLTNSPNLETLVIKGLVHQVTDICGDACPCIPKKKQKNKKRRRRRKKDVCCLSTCRVKVLNISGYRGTTRERKQMQHFLANLKCLETVKVGVEVDRREDNNDSNNKYLRITNTLMKLPRVSSNCLIHFF